ncbi:coiled-coil domain-containing protein 87 [Porphyrio hochstetteri]
MPTPKPTAAPGAAAATVQELYRELSRAVVLTEWRQIHRDPVIEPAAAAVDLLPKNELRPRNTGQPQLRHGDATQHRERQPTSLFDEYLWYVAATGSDFLHTIFLPCRSAGEEELLATPPLPRTGKEPAPQPAEKGFWKPVLLDPVPEGMEKLQRRLHRLWAALDVPNHERLDMAVKYGSGAVTARLPAALDAWEAAAAGILRRERLLARLERLEERGSDPTRFFRGAPASARGEEARSRGILLAALARCEARLSPALRRISDGFGDTVTFRGRPYAEKMRRDRVEMLYWLQQRRRAGAFQDVFGVQPPGPDSAGMAGGQ